MSDPTLAGGLRAARWTEALTPGLEGWIDEGVAIDQPWEDVDLSRR